MTDQHKLDFEHRQQADALGDEMADCTDITNYAYELIWLRQQVKNLQETCVNHAQIETALGDELAALKAKGENMHDKNGTEIKAGDTLFNPHDRDQYHTVLQDGDGKLYLGDFDSPLERYAPQTWWEVTHNT